MKEELKKYINDSLMLNGEKENLFHKLRSKISNSYSAPFIEELKEVITKIRNIRAEMNVHPSKKASLIIVTKKYQKSIEASKEFLKKLGFAEEISVREKKESIPENAVNV